MGERVLAAFGVVAPMDGVLASGLSAAPTSADAATSFTAERTGSSEEAQLRALYRQAVAQGGPLVVFTGGVSSASTRSTSRAPEAEPLLDTGCPPRPGSRRTPRREAISPTITLHPRKHP
jgi:hypothetical protein